MRRTYKLSEQTRQVLTGNVDEIAAEMDCSDKYIYAFLSGGETDRYALFRELYKACVLAGAPVCHWDNDLATIRNRYLRLQPGKTLVECLTEKIGQDAETTAALVDALKDGVISDAERSRIKVAIDKERQNLDLLELRLDWSGVGEQTREARA